MGQRKFLNNFLTFFLFIFSLISVGPVHAVINLPAENVGRVVEHSYYHLSYAEEYEQSEWVSYRLSDDMLRGSTRRDNDFRVDPAVTTGSASPGDYANSGYSRGHLVPAGDMKVNSTAMSETFYMSNMSPQDYDFNSGIWNNLENQVRDWVREKGELYIVSGPVLHNNLRRLRSGNVAIPEQFFKVLVFKGRRPGETKMIAFLMANEASREPLENFVVTTDLVEELSGVDFFPELEEEDYLESRIDTSFWFGH